MKQQDQGDRADTRAPGFDNDGVELGPGVAYAIRHAPAGILSSKGAPDLRNQAEYARGMTMPATWFHDAGAAARCNRCRRYTTDLRALSHQDDPSCPTCECGEKTYWTGSFAPPTEESKWCLTVEEASERCVGCPREWGEDVLCDDCPLVQVEVDR